MLLFHEVCHSSKIYLLIEGLKLENGILKEVGSNESDVFDDVFISFLIFMNGLILICSIAVI